MKFENLIKEKVDELFSLINQPLIQNYYIKNSQNWDALCASLHIIKDLQRPKNEYYSLESINHLEVIGIMQVLYMEQDSIWTLTNAIKETSNSKFLLPEYENVRRIRNQAFGHPSDKAAGKVKTRHFFDIENSEMQFIKHIYWGNIEGISSERFSVTDLVMENSKATLSYLELIIQVFKAKFDDIMNGYKIRFEELFKDVNYIFEKILTKENDKLAIDLYPIIDDDIAKVKIGLNERNMLYEFEKRLNVLEFLSDKLKLLFYSYTYTDIEFYTYASTLFRNIKELHKELIGIDKLFADDRIVDECG